jgi:RNA polymerase sigma-70 factor (ECF subfamily)
MADPIELVPGRELSIEQLVVEYHAVLYRYAFRLSGSVSDAEDLSQQVFLIAQQKASQVREQGNMRAWLFTVLRNCYLKNCRRNIPVPAANLDLDIESVADELEVSEFDEQLLQAAIGELADEFKLVVLMFYFEEQSYREIAEALDIPIGTVMSRLSRAKGYLRRRLSQHELDDREPQPSKFNTNTLKSSQSENDQSNNIIEPLKTDKPATPHARVQGLKMAKP